MNLKLSGIKYNPIMKVTTNSSRFKMKHTATDMPEFAHDEENMFSKVSTPNNGNVKRTD